MLGMILLGFIFVVYGLMHLAVRHAVDSYEGPYGSDWKYGYHQWEGGSEFDEDALPRAVLSRLDNVVK